MTRVTTTKLILLALALVIAVAAVIGAVWELWHQPTQQIITLPNGEQYRFAGVTCGTKHVQPTLAARVASQIPSPLTNLVQQVLGKRLGPITSFKTSEPSLSVWFQSLTMATPPAGARQVIRAMLSDQKEVVAGKQGLGVSSLGGCPGPVVLEAVVPKRSPVLQCVLLEYLENDPRREIGRVRFPNPLFGRFPQWHPESLPAVKHAGDLEVRLENFITGVPVQGPEVVSANGRPVRDYRPVQRGDRACTVFDLSLKSLRGTNEEWAIASADLGDATGNHINAISGVELDSDGYRNSFAGALWPDEAAWRLQLVLKRKSGFAPAELVTFKNVPLFDPDTTNTLYLTNATGGIPVVLRDYVLETQSGYEPWFDRGRPKFRVETADGLDGVSFDFVQMTTDEGRKAVAEEIVLRDPSRPTIVCRHVVLRSIPAAVKTVDVTWAVQKTRTVEFLVKPPKRE
jgi:hypothetical protein